MIDKVLSSKHIYWIIGILSGTLVSVSFLLGLFSGLEKYFEDILVSPKKISPEIVIVAIDDESISKIGQWPWPREYFADAFRLLSKKPPKVVGVDVVFSEKSRIGEEDDGKLQFELNNIPYPLILASEAHNIEPKDDRFEASNFLFPREIFRTSKNVYLNHVNLFIDTDGVVRQFPLNISVKNNTDEKTYDSLSYNLSVLGGKKPDITNVNKTSRIVYSSYPGGIRRVPFWRLLEDEGVRSDLASKIVLIGATAPDLHDEQLTPFSRGIPMPGVEIQANILNMFLNNYRLTDVSASFMIFLIFSVALITSIIFIITHGILKPILINLVLLLLYIISIILLFEMGIVINLVHIVFAWFLSSLFQVFFRYILSERNKKELRDVFSKYVSKNVLDEILVNPKEVKLGGEEKVTSILFSDIRGFTSMSEKMSPTELTNYLNRYLTSMTDVILARRGLIDKYVGDAIMAFWGAPLANSNHSLDALESALDMISNLKNFNDENKKLNKPEIDIGVGINSGHVVAGNVGSRERLSYTLIGDAVNLASRLEGLNKSYGTNIIVSESVIKNVGEKTLKDKNIHYRLIDNVKVKGKNQGVSIYEVFNKDKYLALKDVLNTFDEAFKEYQRGKWTESLSLINKILNIKSDDGPTNLLKERCEEFIKNPPENWRGVFELTSK